jgi:pantoate--beta-alanine ligase
VITVTTRAELQVALTSARSAGSRIGLVPTMGFLHEGHLSLLDIARSHADVVVMSLFVNPLQFSPGEDFERYPRDSGHDAALAVQRGVAILFAPPVTEMYPDGKPRTFVEAPGLDDRLCGAFRPGHFRGVLTVIAKLLNLVRPDVAVFGRKDYQQLVLARRMVRDLDFDVTIEGAPTVRDSDGLAMSSRNVYLSADERAQAALLRRALLDADAAFRAGVHNAADLLGRVRDRLATAALVRTQYVELVEADSLDPSWVAANGDVLAIAAFVGRTRLIDNLALGELHLDDG